MNLKMSLKTTRDVRSTADFADFADSTDFDNSSHPADFVESVLLILFTFADSSDFANSADISDSDDWANLFRRKGLQDNAKVF